MFANREAAGRLLAQKLDHYQSAKKTVILAIPRGGVVVGRILAERLNLPLDVLVVKKLGAPGNPELAIGAVAPQEVKAIDWELALRAGASQEYLDAEVIKKQEEIKTRIGKLRGDKAELALEDKTAILTDDGIATGSTIKVAIKYIKQKKPKSIVLAIPVAPPDTIEKLTSLVNELVVLETPSFFGAVGQFYDYFPQVSDEEVKELLSSKQ